ncbi:MAG: hypothetical protein BGP10_04045 [Rhodanobacter sp. 68-29]|nr:MAG: hypothetical protein ABT17_14090 [Rhodanobacter sp. SCN 69-32]OJY61689.1 MAG: hypothetical protein BGP10_04045 [Rhodanobacter sp. 68-29]
MLEITFAGGRRFGGSQCGFIQEAKHPANAFVALSFPRSVTRPAVDEAQHFFPEGTLQITFDRAPGTAACSSSLQHKRTAGEIAGAYEIVEQPGKDAQRLAAAALGQRTDK